MTNTVKPRIIPSAMNFKKLEESVQRIKSLDIKTVYPGYGKSFDLNKEG